MICNNCHEDKALVREGQTHCKLTLADVDCACGHSERRAVTPDDRVAAGIVYYSRIQPASESRPGWWRYNTAYGPRWENGTCSLNWYGGSTGWSGQRPAGLIWKVFENERQHDVNELAAAQMVMERLAATD